jgi:hypothetical protein
MGDRGFDAIGFMREARGTINAETRDMSLDEVAAYIEERAERVRRELVLAGGRRVRRHVSRSPRGEERRG